MGPMYYVVYAFAVFVFIVGALMYFLPSSFTAGFVGGNVRRISGTCLYGCGYFLLSNSDLIVTYIRMKQQMHKLRQNTEKYEKGLEDQEKVVKKLKNTEQVFKKIDEKFSGDLAKA